MEYSNLTQRSISYFLNTYADFKPLLDVKTSANQQKKAYDFIKSLYQKAFDEPAILCAKQLPDDSYDRWQLNKSKPGLDVNIRKNITKMEEIISAFFQVCFKGKWKDGHIVMIAEQVSSVTALNKLKKFAVKVTKDNQFIYIDLDKDTFKGLKLLAEVSNDFYEEAEYKNTPYVLFSRGVFDIKDNFNKSVFMNNCNKPAVLAKLIQYLEQSSYRRIDNREYSNKLSRITLDYIKFYDPKDKKLGANWNVRTHSGIELIYDEIKNNNFCLGLRIPYFKKILLESKKMNETVRNFVIAHTKKCDGCRYCVQTDKTGKRPLARIEVSGQKLCPYYPGFSFKFFEIDDELVQQVIELLQFIDNLAQEEVNKDVKE